MCKQIKRGTFSTVTIYSDRDSVDIVSDDYAKECMALGWFPVHSIFPAVEFSSVDGIDYHMKKYTTKFLKRNLNADQWPIYSALRRVAADYQSSMYFTVASLVECMEKEKGNLPLDVYDAILDAINAMGNYGNDIGFEISPRNCAIDNGKLILLDCFFNVSQLRTKLTKS